MNSQPKQNRVTLVFALIWCGLLGVFADVVPVYTPQEVTVQGVQPRLTLFQAFGFTGLLPTFAVALIIWVEWWLLSRQSVDHRTNRVTLARAIALAACAVWMLAVAFTHLPGLVATPIVFAMMVAAWGTRRR